MPDPADPTQQTPSDRAPGGNALKEPTSSCRTPDRHNHAAAVRRWLATAVVWAAVALGAVWAFVRVFGLDRGWPAVQVIAFTPYVAAASLVPAATAAVMRRWWAAIAAGAVFLTLAGCVLPRVIAAPTAPDGGPDGVAVRVMAANLRVGGADAARLVDLVRERHVDVLALQEVTPGAAAALFSAGVVRVLPHYHVNPLAGVTGSAIYTRFPIRDAAVSVNPGGFTQVKALIDVAGAAPVVIESVHPVAPSSTAVTGLWRDGLRGQSPADPAGPLRILAGDFNATLDHSDLRRVLATGYVDAAAQVGAGLTPTWPYYGRRTPVTPKVTIDHILADERIGVRNFAVFAIPRTDHRAILATLVLPRA